MNKLTPILILLLNALLSSLPAISIESDQINIHSHQDHNSQNLMFGYQIGIAEVHSNNNHMSNDSGALLGIHLMKQIQSKVLKNKTFLAAGAHTILTDDKHVGVMLGIMYQLNKNTTLSFMPGLMYMKHQITHSHESMPMKMTHTPNPEWQNEEAFHIEIIRSITLFNYELNPSIGWMSSSTHDLYSFGLNFHF